MRHILFLILLLGATTAHARAVPVQWNCAPLPASMTFALQACLVTRTGCAWRDVQYLGARRRTTTVQVPTTGPQKCFRVLTISGSTRSEPSNTHCP